MELNYCTKFVGFRRCLRRTPVEKFLIGRSTCVKMAEVNPMELWCCATLELDRG